MASWYGSDIFRERFKHKEENAGGYLSYTDGLLAKCVFFSSDSKPKALVTISFDSTYNVSSAVVDGQERALTKTEMDLFTIRQIALAELKIDTLFKSYKDMSLNLIPLNDSLGKRVYILTGPQKNGIVVFGNDYLLTFDNDNRLTSKKQLHRNLIVIDYGKPGEKVVGAMHTHSKETGDLITAIQ